MRHWGPGPELAQDARGRPELGRGRHPASEREVDEPRHSFQTVLRDEHGESQVVHEALQGGEDVFGGLRIELAGGLVE
jgi:hypothetical protein